MLLVVLDVRRVLRLLLVVLDVRRVLPLLVVLDVGLLRLLVELNRMGKTVMIATHDLGLIRASKHHVSARVLRIADRTLQTAGVDL